MLGREYDKLGENHLAALKLVAIRIWLRGYDVLSCKGGIAGIESREIGRIVGTPAFNCSVRRPGQFFVGVMRRTSGFLRIGRSIVWPVKGGCFGDLVARIERTATAAENSDIFASS